jgi:hypothetical protein
MNAHIRSMLYRAFISVLVIIAAVGLYYQAIP